MIVKSMSVNEFCLAGQEYLRTKDHASFVKLMLNGIHEGDQVAISPRSNRIRHSLGHKMGVLRDYDSVLGIDETIRIESDITIYPLVQFHESLSKDVHFKYSFANSKGVFNVPPHQIPNICIGKWKLHNTIRILFLDLYSPDHNPERASQHTLTQTELAEFYEKGLRPTLKELLGHHGNELPPKYQSELFRAQGHDGKLSYGTLMLPRWSVELFRDKLLKNLEDNEVEWGRRIAFLHQIRGVKNTTRHAWTEEDGSMAFDEFLEENGLPLGILSRDNWYVDVGLELSSKEHEGSCLAWRTDRHHMVVGAVLPGIGLEAANRVTSLGNASYTRDLVSHMTAVSGCRIGLGRYGGDFQACYLQMYMTDKSVTARQDGRHHAKYITASDLLHGKEEKFFDNIYSIYSSSAEDVRSCARIEIRVPAQHATKVFIGVDEDKFRYSVYAFSCKEWWCLRALRAMALGLVSDWQRTAAPRLRAGEEALLLTAAIPLLTNSLHATIDTHSASREVMKAALPLASPDNPHLMRDEFVLYRKARPMSDNAARGETDETVPCAPYGLIFLRTIRLGEEYPIPRFAAGGLRPFLSPKAFKYIFNDTYEQVRLNLLSPAIARPRNPNRTKNRARGVKFIPPPPGPPVPPLFEFADADQRIGLPVHDVGSAASEDEDIILGANLGLDHRLTEWWRAFLIEILQLSPNRREAHKGPYIKLTDEQRQNATVEVFQEQRLSKIFDDCAWSVVNTAEWKVNFDRLWPPKEYQLNGKAQGFNRASWYINWFHFRQSPDVSNETVELARNQIWQLFKNLYWMPKAESDRLWRTGNKPGFTKSSGVDIEQPAPLIYVHRMRPIWEN